MFSLVSPSYQPFLFHTLGSSFFLPFFSWQPSFRNVVENFSVYFYCHLAIFRLQILSSAGYFPPITPAFHPFRTPITRPFLSHLPNRSQCSHPPYSPELSSPVYVPYILRSFFAPLYRKCLVIPFLLRRFI